MIIYLAKKSGKIKLTMQLIYSKIGTSIRFEITTDIASIIDIKDSQNHRQNICDKNKYLHLNEKKV